MVATPWPSGRTLVYDHGFPGGYQSVKRFVRKLRGSTPSRSGGIIQTAAGEEGAGRLRNGPDGARSTERQVPPHAIVRADAGLQPQVGAAADLAFQFPCLGRAA